MRIKSDRDQSLLIFLLEQLDGLPELRSRRMFGAYGMYSGELFFAIVHHGCVYFKTDDKTKKRYQALNLPPFKPGDDYKPFKYHQVPVDVIEDAEKLMEWAQEALDVSREAYEAKLLKQKKNDSLKMSE